MRNSLILLTAARLLLPLLLLFSLFLLIRGHNEPGGGFAGGLVAAAAFVLYAIASDVTATRRAIRIDPRRLIGCGLLVSLGSGALQLGFGLPFGSGAWGYLPLPGGLKIALGTPLLFDAGVYLVVIGVMLTILLPLEEMAERAWQNDGEDDSAEIGVKPEYEERTP